MRKARDDRMLDAPSRELEAHAVERVAGARDDIADRIDELARLSGMDHGFSAREEFKRPWARIWVARATSPSSRSAPRASASTETLVAFLIAWHVADELHVLNVATSPSERRRGIATQLLDASLEYAAETHVRIALLEVRRSNRDALRLYRRLGFTAMGFRAGYYADNGEDAIEMVIAFDPTTGQKLPGRDEIRIDVGGDRG